jgi:predicted nuclease of predicted toxin-antitoxin system
VENVGLKLLLDQHLSRKLVPLLQPAFPESTHVVLHGLDRGDDDALWSFALAHGLAIVSKDEDFQVLSFTRGHPPKVIWLRSGNGPTGQVLELIERSRQIIETFGADPDRSLLQLP